MLSDVPARIMEGDIIALGYAILFDHSGVNLHSCAARKILKATIP